MRGSPLTRPLKTVVVASASGIPASVRAVPGGLVVIKAGSGVFCIQAATASADAHQRPLEPVGSGSVQAGSAGAGPGVTAGGGSGGSLAGGWASPGPVNANPAATAASMRMVMARSPGTGVRGTYPVDPACPDGGRGRARLERYRNNRRGGAADFSFLWE